MRSLFRYEGPVWNFCNAVTDVLGLSLLWCLCSLPVVTAGAAATALYDAAVHGIRCREAHIYRRFFRTFREVLKTSLLCFLLWGILLLFGAFSLMLLDAAAQEDGTSALIAGAYRVLLLLPLTAASWSCMLLSRFENPFRTLTGNAVRFLIAHPLASLGVGILSYASVYFVVNYPIGLCFAPAVTALGWSLMAEPVFKKHGGEISVPTAEAEETPES